MTARVVLSAVDRMSTTVRQACSASIASLGNLEQKLRAGKEASTAWQSRFGETAQLAGSVGRGMMIAGAGITASLVGATKAAADYGEAILAASQTTGIATESWSRLRYAAEQSNVDVGALQSSIFRFNRMIGEAAQGNDTACRAFDNLGINIRDVNGNLKPTEILLGEVADKINAIPDPAIRGAMAMELMGRGGSQMLPLLAEGSAGIAQLGKEAEKLGLVLDENAAKAADEFNDNVDKLKKSVLGMAIQLGQVLMPVLQQGVEWITSIVSSYRAWAEEHPVLNKALTLTASTIGIVVFAMGSLLSTVARLAPAIIALRGAGGISGLASAFGGMTSAVSASSAGLLASLGPIALVAAALVGLGLEIHAVANAYKAMRDAQEEAAESSDRLAAKEDELRRLGFETQRDTAVRLFGEEGGRRYDRGELTAAQNEAVRQEQRRLRASGQQKAAVRASVRLNASRDAGPTGGGTTPPYTGAGVGMPGQQHVMVHVSASPEFQVQYQSTAQREVRRGRRR